MNKLSGLKPERVLHYFEEICSIPHGSGDMEKISQYCVDFAKANGLNYSRDKMNNVIIKKPAFQGYETHDAVILQGHLDMVCEKDAGSNIDFATDGLDIRTDGQYIWANGTTLGGDDGIAVAMVLAILEDPAIPHPELTALFTTDEETGMYGAEALEANGIAARKLINIDSENEGVLTVSCAGGARANLSLPLKKGSKAECFKITVKGLIGGHSGVEIDKGRHNSNMIMAQFLKTLGCVKIASIEGGLKDNAIPVLTQCICCAEADLEAAAKAFTDKVYTENDPDLEITVEAAGRHILYDDDSSKAIVELLCALPNGIMAMSQNIEGLVETSLNLGILYCEGDRMNVSFAVRSSVNEAKQRLLDNIKKIAENFGADYSDHGHYPAWEYRKDSPLRDTMVAVYKNLYGKEPVVEAIHAGLECGLLCEKLPGLDAVSFGPDMQDIHTPRERLSVASTERTYNYLLETLKAL